MSQTTAELKTDIINKLGVLDFMITSLGKIHKTQEDKQLELYKKISTRKFILMEELFKLVSPLV